MAYLVHIRELSCQFIIWCQLTFNDVEDIYVFEHNEEDEKRKDVDFQAAICLEYLLTAVVTTVKTQQESPLPMLTVNMEK